jgi:CheY-like chemotaxis protein
VLLVDEGLALLLDAKWSLEAEGFVVDVAENGLRALDIFRGRTKAYAAVVVADGVSVLNAIDTATGIVKAAAEAGLPVPPLLLLESALSGTGRVPGAKGLVRRRSSLDVPSPFRYVVRTPVQALQLSMVLAACGLKTSGTIPDVSRLRRYDAEAIHGNVAICVSENSAFIGVLKQAGAPSHFR